MKTLAKIQQIPEADWPADSKRGSSRYESLAVKRAETFWQALILLLVFSTTLGVYGILGFVWSRLRYSQSTYSGTPFPSGAAVQIVEPLDGTIFQASPSLPIRAVVLKTGFVRLDLQVDGVATLSSVHADPKAVPWLVDWAWSGAAEGTHTLAVVAQTAKGRLQASAPVSVTVVPTGGLLFASNREGPYGLYAMGTDGADPSRLTMGPGDARQPAVRRDGALAFAAQTGTGQGVIRVMNSGQQAGQDLFAGRDPAWSADGTRLAFAAGVNGVSQVFVGQAGGGTPIQITTEEIYAGQPAWSPDGQQLAYVAERNGNLDIWAVALDGSQPRRLTDDAARDWAPAWSPDGSRLAFISDRGGSYQIYTMRADGANPVPLTAFAQGAEAPRWSPDGFWLAFVAYTGDGTGVSAREIYIMRANGQLQVRLTHNAFDDTEPDWSRGP
jgi:hypothetical protein